jgi:hypothetical protein
MRRAVRWLRNKATRFTRDALHHWFRRRPAPLPLINVLQRLSAGDQGLTCRRESTAQESLPEPLASLLGDTLLGKFALDPDSILFLLGRIQVQRPRVVLELGSGASTPCIAYTLTMIGEGGQLVSVDHDRAFLEQTRLLVDRLEVNDHVHLVHAPLQPAALNGRDVISYDAGEVRSSLSGLPAPSFILVDGPPRSTPGGRFATLPLLADWVDPEASWYLDDALTRVGLEVANAWKREPRIVVRGVHCIGTGILAGHVGR